MAHNKYLRSKMNSVLDQRLCFMLTPHSEFLSLYGFQYAFMLVGPLKKIIHAFMVRPLEENWKTLHYMKLGIDRAVLTYWQGRNLLKASNLYWPLYF